MAEANSLPNYVQVQALVARTQQALTRRAHECIKENEAAKVALEAKERLRQSLRPDLGPAVDFLLEALGPLDGLQSSQGKLAFQHEIYDLGHDDTDRGLYAIRRVRIVALVLDKYRATLADIHVTATERCGLYYVVNSKRLSLDEACATVLASVVPQISFD